MGVRRRIKLVCFGFIAYALFLLCLIVDNSYYGELGKTSNQHSRTARQLQGDLKLQTSRPAKTTRQFQNYVMSGKPRELAELQNDSPVKQIKNNETTPGRHITLLSSREENSTRLPNCTVSLSSLREKIEVDESFATATAIIQQNPDVEAGGHWRPKGCITPHKIAILIPFRDRHLHLSIFLRHMHPFLQKQLVDYTIYVIEQTSNSKFNRGFLFNVGVTEALKDNDYDCFFFHDVDTLPENERNIYRCPTYPTLYASATSKFEYLQLYEWFFGCVTVMRPVHYKLLNGYSNEFLGWGAEDDDFSRRMNLKRVKRAILPPEIGRYHSVGHKEAERNPDNDETFEKKEGKRLREGLNSTEYRLLTKLKLALYTLFLVEPLYNETAIIVRNVGKVRYSELPKRQMSELEALKNFKSRPHNVHPADVIFRA